MLVLPFLVERERRCPTPRDGFMPAATALNRVAPTMLDYIIFEVLD